MIEEIYVYSGVPLLSLGALQRESEESEGHQDTSHWRHSEECDSPGGSKRFDNHPRQVRRLCVARIDPVAQSPQTRGNGIANHAEIKGCSVDDGAMFSHHVKVGPVGLKAYNVNMQSGLFGKLYRQIVQRMLNSRNQH